MDDVRVKRDDLLAKIVANRDAHKALFEQAQAGFRARAIEELDDMIAAAKRGDVRLFVGLTAPEDHSADYDRAIAMLEMSQDDVVTIDRLTFAQLVRNEWAWFKQAQSTNTTYASGGKIGGSR